MDELLRKLGMEISEQMGRKINGGCLIAGGFGGGWLGKTLFDKYKLRDKIESLVNKKPTISEEHQEALDKLDERIKENKKK